MARDRSDAGRSDVNRSTVDRRSDLISKNNGIDGIKGVTLSLIHPEESEEVLHSG
jgi:hypothetical protein